MTCEHNNDGTDICTRCGEDLNSLRTFDLTPTWAGCFPALFGIAVSGSSDQGRIYARSELKRMARIADEYIEHVKGHLEEPLVSRDTYHLVRCLADCLEEAHGPDLHEDQSRGYEHEDCSYCEVIKDARTFLDNDEEG